MEWYGELKEIAGMVAPWLAGGGAALIINYLKEYLNIPDKKWLLGVNARTWFAMLVSFFIGLVLVLAQGGFDPSNLVVSNVAETLGIVWASATYIYFKAMDGGSPDPDNRGVF